MRKLVIEHGKLPDTYKSKDRGDNTRRVIKILNKKKTESETQVEPERLGDRGDADKRNEPVKKPDEDKKKVVKARYTTTNTNTVYGEPKLSDKNLERIKEKIGKQVAPLDIDKKRKLFQTYTFRRTSEPNNASSVSSKSVQEPKTDENVLVNRASEGSQTDGDARPELPDAKLPRCQKPGSLRKRQPIIKTLTQKGDSTRVYKAVCFVEPRKKTTPLRINISNKSALSANSNSQKSIHRLSDPESTHTHYSKAIKNTNSPISTKKMVVNRKFKNRSGRKRNCSPVAPTHPPVSEVAKWAPQSVNDHTKPYYEAWVDTTLTAFSNDSEKILREKQKIMQIMYERMQYQSVLGLSEEELSDEKYTGRIKVRHR